MFYCAIDDELHLFKNKERLAEYVELLFEALDLEEISEFSVVKYTKSESKQLLAASFNDEENSVCKEWIKITTPEGKFWTCPRAWRLHCITPLYDKAFNLLASKRSMKALVRDLLREKRR